MGRSRLVRISLMCEDIGLGLILRIQGSDRGMSKPLESNPKRALIYLGSVLVESNVKHGWCGLRWDWGGLRWTGMGME